jgi:hypothetical protein
VEYKSIPGKFCWIEKEKKQKQANKKTKKQFWQTYLKAIRSNTRVYLSQTQPLHVNEFKSKSIWFGEYLRIPMWEFCGERKEMVGKLGDCELWGFGVLKREREVLFCLLFVYRIGTVGWSGW